TSPRSFVSVRSKCAASRLAPATDLPLITTVERLQDRRAHQSNIVAHLRQLQSARRGFGRVRPFGDLVVVRSKLADFAKNPRQLLALGVRTLHGARPRPPQGQRPQISADAQTGLRRSVLDKGVILFRAAQRYALAFGVLDARPPAPRG